MTTQTLDSVTLQSLENYRAAANQAVAAYRQGGRRLVGAVNGALQNSVYPRTAKLAPRITDRLDEVRGNVAEIVVKGIDQVAEQASKVIALGSQTAAAQVDKVARFTAAIDNEFVANGLQAAARLTLPGAKAALAVSSRVAEGASALAGYVGAHPVEKAVRQAKAAVKTGAKRAAGAAAKSVKSAKAPIARAQRTVRKAVKKAA